MDKTNNSAGLITKLSIMMFLQFFIWGAWYTSVSLFMSAQGMEKDIYWVYTAGPLGAIFAPFLTGLVADRFLNTEKVLSILFLGGAASLLALPQLAEPGASATVNRCILIHMLFYMPTLALSASLSFKHLKDGVKHFPIVRVWGTIGWIAAGLLISALNAEKTALQFYVAGGASLVLGFFCLSLPKTPAPLKGQAIDLKAICFWDAWSLLKKPSFAIFMISSFLICIPLAAYYAYLQNQMAAMGIENVAATKTMGQGSEIIFMLLMPFLFRKLGVKKMIAIGILAWASRYALFALGASQQTVLMIYAGILLHGICYDFFFVTGQIYVDQAAPKNILGQAQSLNIFFTQGLGLFVGAIVCGKLYNRAFGETSAVEASSLSMWPDFWWPLCGLAAIILVIFIIAFHHKDTEGADAKIH